MFGLNISDAARDLIINIINIIILYVIVKKLAYKPVKKLLADRRARIDGELSSAKAEKSSAEEMRLQYEEKMRQSEEKKAAVLSKAEAEARKRAAEILADAEKKAAEITENSHREAEKIHNERLSELKGEVTDISFEIAEKILARSVKNEDNIALANEFFDEYSKRGSKA